jgi:hypothetical protein
MSPRPRRKPSPKLSSRDNEPQGGHVLVHPPPPNNEIDALAANQQADFLAKHSARCRRSPTRHWRRVIDPIVHRPTELLDEEIVDLNFFRNASALAAVEWIEGGSS